MGGCEGRIKYDNMFMKENKLQGKKKGVKKL